MFHKITALKFFEKFTQKKVVAESFFSSMCNLRKVKSKQLFVCHHVWTVASYLNPNIPYPNILNRWKHFFFSIAHRVYEKYISFHNIWNNEFVQANSSNM